MARVVEFLLGVFLFAIGGLAKLGLLDDAARLLEPEVDAVAAANPWAEVASGPSARADSAPDGGNLSRR